MKPTPLSLGQPKMTPFNPEAMAFDPNHNSALNQRASDTSFEYAAPIDAMRTLMDLPPHIRVHQKISGSDMEVIDIGELNASLGLPGLQPLVGVRPIHLHPFRAVQGLPEAHNMLIDSALDKPLTANALAEYLNSTMTVPSSDMTAAPGYSQGSFTILDLTGQDDDPEKKLLRPPPGLGYEHPQGIRFESVSSADLATLEMRHAPRAPRLLQTPQYNSQYQATSHGRHHAFLPSGQRRQRTQRTTTRSKRLDQGPEPSAADIYPDDANWDPSQKSVQAKDRVHSHPTFALTVPIKRDFHIEGAAYWPTPAEGCRRQTLGEPPMPIHFSGFNLFENHVPPTTEDMYAADKEVISIIDEVLSQMMDTFSDPTAIEDRELHYASDPLQGNKYGLKYHGLGLNDLWNPPMPAIRGIELW